MHGWVRLIQILMNTRQSVLSLVFLLSANNWMPTFSWQSQHRCIMYVKFNCLSLNSTPITSEKEKKKNTKYKKKSAFFLTKCQPVKKQAWARDQKCKFYILQARHHSPSITINGAFWRLDCLNIDHTGLYKINWYNCRSERKKLVGRIS